MRFAPSVRAKLIGSSLVLLVVVSFAFTYAWLGISQSWVEEELKQRAITFARQVSATIGDRREFENQAILAAQIQRMMEARQNVTNIDFLAFGEAWPRVLASSDPSWRPALRPQQIRELQRNRVVARLVKTSDGRYWEVVAPVVLEGSVAGAIAVQFSLVQADRRAARVRMMSLAITGASVLVAAGLIGLVVRWVVDRPIRRFLTTFDQVERGDLSSEVRLRTGDEFGKMATHFNRMLWRVRGASEEQEERVRQATAELSERYAEVRRLSEVLFQTERRLRHSERLALMGRTLGMVAHEVGTPLHSIAGHLELLRHELSPEAIEGSPKRRLAIIESQIHRVSETMEQLLSLTRRPTAEHTPQDLEVLLTEVLGLVGPGLTAASIRVETDLDRPLPSVSGDRHQLQQAFLNLIANALDAMPAGGTLSITARTQRRAGRECVAVRIADTGPGIQSEHLKQIFEPFYTTKESGKGVGLGLSITQQIVQEHDGEIEVESAEGQGATFLLIFPATEGPTTEGPTRERAA